MATKKTTHNTPDTKNPSLKKYFRYMVNSRKLTIQFTQTKIREIIETDLQIEFQNFSDLLKDVSVEAFAFYIQGWPGWQDQFQKCLDDPDGSYLEFKKFLREKILNLIEKEKQYCSNKMLVETDTSTVNTLTPPAELFTHLPKDSTTYKIKLPYTLEIYGRQNILNQVFFEHKNGQTTMNYRPIEMGRNYSNLQILNHPYVHIQFKLPSLIKFSRKNIHKIEMFLCRPTDYWTFPKQDHILDIRKFPARTNTYSWKFMQTFFQKLYAVMSSYGQFVSIHTYFLNIVIHIVFFIFQINTAKKVEIMLVCNEFLNDIAEANLNSSTIQECSEVTYIIGDSMYYSDSAQNK